MFDEELEGIPGKRVRCGKPMLSYTRPKAIGIFIILLRLGRSPIIPEDALAFAPKPSPNVSPSPLPILPKGVGMLPRELLTLLSASDVRPDIFVTLLTAPELKAMSVDL